MSDWFHPMALIAWLYFRTPWHVWLPLAALTAVFVAGFWFRGVVPPRW